ncbi:hypothetical protein MNBD_GAMMA05-1666 [hydrothermal vent metagenome]|uniref:Copper metallochaperone, bacterial analog of Cox17 protein n=1 Tax=hydrothermal vent metagenome TaxID=652676 RepID=A0A3B0WDY1_9ZZZZ
MKNYFATLILLFSPLSSTVFADANPNTLSVKDAWIAEAPPVSKVMVAYMTLENNGTQDITLVKAESDLYSSIEFHETRHEKGMARMIRHNNLIIPAKEHIALKRGGKHLMMFNPVKRLKAGDTVTIKLTTNNDVNQTFEVIVKKSQY